MSSSSLLHLIVLSKLNYVNNREQISISNSSRFIIPNTTPCEKVFGQIGIAFRSPAKLLFPIGRKENFQLISSRLRSVANRVSKNQKSAFDNSPINC